MQSKWLSTILVGSAVIFCVTYTIASQQRPVSKPDGGDAHTS
jgi:hypothetical protein